MMSTEDIFFKTDDKKVSFLQLEEERLATIDRDNRILLERMAHIVNSKGDSYNDYESKRHAICITCCTISHYVLMQKLAAQA